MNSVSEDTACDRLKGYLIASTGLAYYAERDELLSKAIDRRIAELGLQNCSAYADILADGEKGTAEMDVMISALTVGETCFFRDEAQFAAIRQVILPDIIARNQSSRRLRIWSAGCATGAEPYSLAILLTHQLADRIAGWNVEIHATDLNRVALTQAAQGKFRPWALRNLSDDLKRECFSSQGSTWTILPTYKRWISFHQVNLAGWEVSKRASTEPRFDLILCCNVMIYFAPEASRSLATQFHHALEDGGWLLVGPSEHNQSNYQAFHAVDASGTRSYHKLPLASERARGAQPEPPALLPATPKLHVPAAIAPKAPTAKPPDPRGQSGASGLECLRQLADRGEWAGAAAYASELLAQDRLNPAIHFYQALVFEHLGLAAQPERFLRQAIYLDRNFALAHYHLGLALKRDGQTRAAGLSFKNALQCLADLPDGAAVTAGPGVTVVDLKELSKMQLENLGAS